MEDTETVSETIATGIASETEIETETGVTVKEIETGVEILVMTTREGAMTVMMD